MFVCIYNVWKQEWTQLTEDSHSCWPTEGMQVEVWRFKCHLKRTSLLCMFSWALHWIPEFLLCHFTICHLKNQSFAQKKHSTAKLKIWKYSLYSGTVQILSQNPNISSLLSHNTKKCNQSSHYKISTVSTTSVKLEALLMPFRHLWKSWFVSINVVFSEKMSQNRQMNGATIGIWPTFTILSPCF